MFNYISTKIQLMAQSRENEALRAGLEQASADIVYLAMMCDVEIEEDEEEEE